jgi:hypothetical protein
MNVAGQCHEVSAQAQKHSRINFLGTPRNERSNRVLLRLFGFDAVESLVKPTSIVALDARPQFDREMADKGRNFEFSDLTR